MFIVFLSFPFSFPFFLIPPRAFSFLSIILFGVAEYLFTVVIQHRIVKVQLHLPRKV